MTTQTKINLNDVYSLGSTLHAIVKRIQDQVGLSCLWTTTKMPQQKRIHKIHLRPGQVENLRTRLQEAEANVEETTKAKLQAA